MRLARSFASSRKTPPKAAAEPLDEPRKAVPRRLRGPGKSKGKTAAAAAVPSSKFDRKTSRMVRRQAVPAKMPKISRTKSRQEKLAEREGEAVELAADREWTIKALVRTCCANRPVPRRRARVTPC